MAASHCVALVCIVSKKTYPKEKISTNFSATALSAFCHSFLAFAIYGSVFGFLIGAYVGLTSVILVDLFGLDRLTNAFGMLLLFQGIAALIGPPAAGLFYIPRKFSIVYFAVFRFSEGYLSVV